MPRSMMRRMAGNTTPREAHIADARRRAQRQRSSAKKLERFLDTVTENLKAGRARNSRLTVEATPELREDLQMAVTALRDQARSWTDVAHHLERAEPAQTTKVDQ